MPVDRACPPWCDRAHLIDSNDLDPIHEQGGAVIPGILRVVRPRAGGLVSVVALGCEVRPTLFSSAVRSDETWLALELGEHGAGVTLSTETWRRVLPELSALLQLL